MKQVPTYTIGKLILFFTLLTLPLMNLTSQPVESAPLESMSVMPIPEVMLYAKTEDAFTQVPRRAEFARAPQTATINVTYSGFSAEARVAFQFAVDIWATQITSDVPIEVQATFQPLPSGVLGSAGAAFSVRDWSAGNAPPRSGIFYPIPLANKLAGVDLFPPGNGQAAAHDINANFSSSFTNWYFGTDGNTPAGEFDFVSVVLHELGHGLGFAGSASVSGSQGFVAPTGFPGVYDIFVENGSEQAITSFTSPSTALAGQLQGGNLFWNSPNAVAANGNSRPKLYAPNPFQQGSSYSHLDESTFSAGDPNSLMTPQIGRAETIHDPGSITRGMLQDMGWTVNNGGQSPTVTPTNTQIPSATPTNTQIPSATPTNTQIPSATPTNTQIPSATPTSPPSNNPEINVNPSSLSSSQSANTTETRTIEIQNNGTGTLTWNINESSTTRVLEVNGYADESDTSIVASVNSTLGSRLALVRQNQDHSLVVEASAVMNSNPTGTVELTLDDGTSENGIGDNGQFVWLNRFTPNPSDYPLALEEIWVQFGNTGVNAGDSIQIVVHQDTDQDGDPATGASLLAGYNTVVVVANNEAWSQYRLTNPLILNGPGDVLIGVVNRYSSEGANDFPARFDTSSSQGRSWVGSYASGDAPNTITYPADEQWGTIDSFGFPGNWMIRGIASTDGGNSCTSSNISWASVSPSSGNTSAGGRSQVNITFNSAGLDAGTYTGNLCINSNDTQNPQIIVPLSLTVNQTATATASPTTIPSATASPTTIPSATASPTTIPSATAIPTTIPSATASPTTIPSATAIPTTIPSATAIPTTIPSATAIPTTIPSATASPTTIPSATPTATTPPAQSGAILRTQNYRVAPNDSFTMRVEAANVDAPGLNAANVTLFYNHDVIQPTACMVDSALVGTCNSNIDGQIQFNGLSTSGLQGEFNIIEVVFQAVGQEDDTSPLDLSTAVFADSNGNAIPVSAQDGSVTIGQALGDVSCDSLVNVVDGLYILQYDVGARGAANSCPLPTGTMLLDNCDVSNDNTCNSVDALFVLQCDVGISNAFCPARFPIPSGANNQPNRVAGGITVGADNYNMSELSTVNVPIKANLGNTSLGAATIQVNFDPTIVQVTACQVENPLFGECNADNQTGLISFNALSVSGIAGDITLAEITLQGTSAGTSSLDVRVQTFANSTGQAITTSDIDGEVTVSSDSQTHTLFLPAVQR